MVTHTPPETPVVPSLAATVLPVRDGVRGLEVLMVVRHHQMDFARGAAVFPGGKVAPADHDPRLVLRSLEMTGFAPAQAALRVAAIRETFEECGLLLARDGPNAAMLDGARLDRIHDRWKDAIAAGGAAFVDMVCEEALHLAGGALQPFAHWVTPEHSPKRFDTYFFIAAAPAGQRARHDGTEAVEAFWIRPLEALRECEQRLRTAMFPTLSNLALLAQSGDVASAIEASRNRPDTRMQPSMAHRADGKKVPVLPANAGYPALSTMLMDQVAR
jgi:8-oxo-dGTP pyrophosphatase MutT (NUDIX family)